MSASMSTPASTSTAATAAPVALRAVTPVRPSKRSARRSMPVRTTRRDLMPGVAGPAFAPQPAPAITPASTATLHQITTVEHQGTVIAFAREQNTGDVYYDILDLKVSTEVDDAEWTGYTRLVFPDELRSVGLDIITVPDRAGAVLAGADAQLQAVSDNTYVHVLQQSTRGTLLLNRYMYKRIIPPTGGAPTPVLEPVWEVRYQRSGKLDVPDGPKDSQSYTAPDGTPFIEPILELPMIRNLAGGRFTAQLLPDQTGSARRWQFFAVNDVKKTLDTFSYPVDASGLPDLTKADVDKDGNAVPDMSLSLVLRSEGGETDLTLDGAPTASLFTLHERVRATGGDDLLLKRTTRDLLAIPVLTATQERRFATLDFALGKDGKLARPPARTVVTAVEPANYALQFDAGTYLGLPSSGTLAVDNCFRIRCWIYPGSDVTGDQFVLRGDTAVAPKQAAPYLKVTQDLRLEFGFGDGDTALAASTTRPVVKPGQWLEAEVCYDNREAEAFSIRVNGSRVAVSRTQPAGLPAGQPLTVVAAPSGGFVGVLDDLKIDVVRDGSWTTVGHWPLDVVDYDKPVPTTPDISGNGNDAQVHGATLIASSAPIPDSGSQGQLYVDERGLSTYAGMLTFAEPTASGTLLTGAGGLVHLYFAGPKQGRQDGVFSVAQYDAQSARAIFEAEWLSGSGSAGQSGTVTFTAARSGVFMNQAEIEIRSGTADPALCEIGMTDQQGHSETWRGVPRALDALVDVLNGASTHDIADPGFLAGRRVFYDNTGTYATARLKAQSHDADAWFVLLSRRPKLIQLSEVALGDIAGRTGELTLSYSVPGWDQPVTQTWRSVPVNLSDLASVLAGTSHTYDYAEKRSSESTMYGLPTGGPGQPHDVLLLTRPDVSEIRIGIADGPKPDLCEVTIEIGDEDRRVKLADVPRDQNGFAAAVNAGETGRYVLAIADGLTSTMANVDLHLPPRLDLRAWTGVIAGFPEQTVAPDASLAAQTVQASIQQESKLSVDGKESIIDGASTLMRALAADRPSDGSPAIVQDSDGPAKLAVAAVGGGWIRVSPHKAIELNGRNYVAFDVPPPDSDVLATAGDMTAEAWCRPGVIDYGTEPDKLKRPRLADYYRRGSVDDPDEEIRWTLGLWPRPALNFGDTTEVSYYPTLSSYPDCTFQLTLSPKDGKAGGTVMTLRTAGIVRNYLRLNVDASQRLTVWYIDGATPVLTSTATLTLGSWTQATVTLRNDKHDASSPVVVALYVDGKLDKEATLPGKEFKDVPANFTVGATNSGYRMQGNATYLWRRALSAQEVQLTREQNPNLEDPDLLVAWAMTEGEGRHVTNLAVSDAGTRTEITNADRVGWTKYGAYGAPWAANRMFSIAAREAVLHGWHHIASSYRSGYAIALGGSDFADCGRDASLDLTDNFSIEATFTPANSGTGIDQALVSKAGNYELRVNAKGQVVVAVTTETLGIVEVASVGGTSDYLIEEGVPCYAAATVSTGSTKPTGGGDKPGPAMYYLHVNLYIDGVLRNRFSKPDLTDPAYVRTSTRNLNLGRSSLGGAYFSGQLSDVRLWNRELKSEAIASTQTRHEPPSTHGLVSGWSWSEGSGRYGYDDTGLNTAVISANNLWRLYAATSRLTLVVDGVEQTDVVYESQDVNELMYGSPQFTAGAVRKSGNRVVDAFDGAMSELRVWKRARTAEQIREDMYRVLSGDETGLAGYWEFDSGSGRSAVDATGNGNTGRLAPSEDPPVWIDGRAPLSNEAKEVYNVLGGQITEFTERITGTPSASEYADTRRDAYGELYSVMKRAYGADRLGAARLVSGYTVGELDMVYAGQVQTEPSVVGFIEGAPPIPAENQTSPYWSDPTTWNTYSADRPTTRVTHAESVTRAFKGGQTDGSSNAVSTGVGLFVTTDFSESVGIGEEIDWTIATLGARGGSVGDADNGTSDESELEFGYRKTTTTVDEIGAGGEWEDPGHLFNPEIGRRYLPGNNGYAVVKSLTADMYLDRLKGSNTVVRTVLVPDPDIPEDVNVITFPINPHYVKNGTLDGMVGFKPDADFPYANLQRGSYFQPVEAYALKRQIERQDKQLEAYYQQFNTKQLSRGKHVTSQGATETGYTLFRDQTVGAEPAYDWTKGLSKRAIVNTYVWTSSGGAHTEQSEIVDTRSESFTGLSSAEGRDGLAVSAEAGFPAGLYAELDATFGTSIEVVSVRSKESETGFGLEVEFDPERCLKELVLDGSGQPVGFGVKDVPGKVTGYRFMTFWIPQNATNFDTFSTRVIDRNWLANSAHPDAAALRTATAQTNGVWRVLHRTTYVSRVAPDLQPAPAESTPEPVTEPAGLAGNTLLVRLVEKEITTPTPSPVQIGAAVRAVLGTGPAAPGRLAALLTWWTAFLENAEVARSEAALALAALRVDLLAYMTQKFAAQLAQAGGEAVNALRGR